MTEAEPFRTLLTINALIAFPTLLYHRIQSQRTGEKLDRRQEGLFILTTLRPIGLVLFLSVFAYMIDPDWMAWASVELPRWLRWVGIALCAAGTILIVWTLRSLGKNLTDTVVTRREHTLVTRGPYRWVRHPFYVSVTLFVLGNSLAAANWFFLAAGCLVLVLLLIRTRTEEEKLLARFGDGYRTYMERTGRFLPRLVLAAVVGVATLAAAPGGATQGPDTSATGMAARVAKPLITSLDHIPIAVRNLEAASARYRQLGFVLKPGRPHANGIRNQHVKFRDGTELELITAPAARDSLTSEYRRLIAAGDGPAFVAFYAPSVDSLVERLEDSRKAHRSASNLVTFHAADSLHYIFFGRRNQSPTDRPRHFAHPNGAESLIGVWLAADDFSAERRTLTDLGVTVTDDVVHAPDTLRVLVARLREGEILLLPRSRQLIPGRRIVGATLRVRDIKATRRALAKGPWKTPPTIETSKGSSIFLSPTITHGMWLEFREPR